MQATPALARWLSHSLAGCSGFYRLVADHLLTVEEAVGEHLARANGDRHGWLCQRGMAVLSPGSCVLGGGEGWESAQGGTPS